MTVTPLIGAIDTIIVANRGEKGRERCLVNFRIVVEQQVPVGARRAPETEHEALLRTEIAFTYNHVTVECFPASLACVRAIVDDRKCRRYRARCANLVNKLHDVLDPVRRRYHNSERGQCLCSCRRSLTGLCLSR